MRLLLANSTSALVHVVLLAALAWFSPSADWFLVDPSLNRGEPILVQMSLPATSEAEMAEVDVKLPLPNPPLLLHVPPPKLDLAQPETKSSHALPPIDVVPAGKLPVSHQTEVEPTEVAATQPSTLESPPDQKTERQEQAESKPPPPKSQASKTPRRIQPAPVIAQRQAVAMPFQAATAVGANVDELPRKLANNQAPVYPTDALLSGIEGRVLLRVLIAADGAVASAEVATSSGSASLDEAAIRAVLRWRFTPARRGGAAVAHEVVVPVRFSIRQG